MKKFILLFLIVLVLISLVLNVSCTATTSSETTSAADTATAATEEAAAETTVAAETAQIEVTEVVVNPESPLDKIQKEGRKPRAAFVYLLSGHEYIDALIKGTEIASEERGFELILKDGQIDAAVIEKHIKALIAEKVDFIIVQTLEGERLRPAFKEAYDANIPIITLNLWVDAPHAGHVGFNSVLGGNAMGEVAVEALDGKGTMAYIDASPGSSIAQGRKAGMEEVIAKYPDIEILDSQFANENREEAMGITEQYLTAYPDINLIVAGTVMESYGAVAALQTAGKLGEVKVVTIDFPKALIPLIEDGSIYGAAYDNPVEIGKKCIDLGGFLLNMVNVSAKWGGVEQVEPAWKSTFTSMYLSSKKVTLSNVNEVKGDAF